MLCYTKDPWKTIIVAVIFLIEGGKTQSQESPEFDKEYLGVSFQPYTRIWESSSDCTLPAWTDYSYEEVLFQVELLSTKFKKIITYGSGSRVDLSSKPWFLHEANNFVGPAAADVNKRANETKLEVILGAYQYTSKDAESEEISHAFAIAQSANEKFPGTVKGISIFNYYNTERNDMENLIQRITSRRASADMYGLKLGTRLNLCLDLIEGENESGRTYMEKIAEIADFVLCGIYPSSSSIVQGAALAVEETGEKVLRCIETLQRINSKLEVYWGDVGWSSRGITWNNQENPKHNNITNMKEFWNQMNEWAVDNNVTVFMFEAFDEKWKNEYSKLDNTPSSRHGGEGHYGWWKRNSNSDITDYTEKINDPTEYWKPEELDAIDDKLCDGSSTLTIVAICLSIILIIVAVIGYLFFTLRKEKQKLEGLTKAEIDAFLNGIPANECDENCEEALQLPYNRDFELDRQNVKIDYERLLGSGNFGVVYSGETVEGEKVAVKTTKSPYMKEPLRSLLSEIKIMSYIGTHENIVKLVGAITDQIHSGIVHLVAEFCSLGSLDDYLRSKRELFVNEMASSDYTEFDEVFETSEDESNTPFHLYENQPMEPPMYANVMSSAGDATQKHLEPNKMNLVVLEKNKITKKHLRKWSSDIANGMEYLSSKKVIHGDLATRNVLISEDQVAKITDFGLSRRIYEYTEYVKSKQEPLPWRWMAPESLKKMSFSTQSDVWAYGVTLWEIFSLGELPYPGLGWEIEFVEKLEQGLRMLKPKQADKSEFEVMKHCWEMEPERRPTFTMLHQYFSRATDLLN